MNFVCNFIFTKLVFRADFSNNKKKKAISQFENESMENESTAFITLLREPIVNCESRENHLRPWRKKKRKKDKKKKKCNDVVTPLTICNANDVAPDFSFLCNTSSIRNYHIKSPLVNKFFIAPPVFGPLYFFYLSRVKIF